MDRLDVGGLPGGLGSAGDAPWWRCDDRRRPAVGVEGGRSARREIGKIQWEHRQPWDSSNSPEWSEGVAVVGDGLATATMSGAGAPPAAATWRRIELK